MKKVFLVLVIGVLAVAGCKSRDAKKPVDPDRNKISHGVEPKKPVEAKKTMEAKKSAEAKKPVETKKPIDSKVTELIKKLGDDNYRMRKQATKELEKMVGEGKDIKSLLEKALAETKDPEVKCRLKKIFKPYTDLETKKKIKEIIKKIIDKKRIVGVLRNKRILQDKNKGWLARAKAKLEIIKVLKETAKASKELKEIIEAGDEKTLKSFMEKVIVEEAVKFLVEVLLADKKASIVGPVKIKIETQAQDVSSLIKALKDKDETVRKEAAEVLKIITGKDFGEDYDKWKKWYEKQGQK